MLQMSVSRLNSLAARFESRDESATSQLHSLQLHLAQVAATLGTCIRVSTAAGNPAGHSRESTPIMQHYVKGEAIYCSTLPREPGTAGQDPFISGEARI
jgi:hypothetical protein